MSIQPKDIIDVFTKKNIKLVNERPDIAQSQAGTEGESSKDYTGRVVFEFFQNAIDRAASNVWLELTESEFIISNDGKPFSIEEESTDKYKKSDFHALNTIHNSNKKAGESVGNKGVGFKSCWNVSEHVIVESINEKNEPWGFELFNPALPENFEDADIKEVISQAGNRVPSFYFPKHYKSKLDNFHDGAKTKVTITLNKDKKAYEEIQKEIDEFKKAKFFFLNQLEDKGAKKYNIYIKDKNTTVVIKSQDEKWSIITLKDNTDFQREFQELQTIRKAYTYENIPEKPNIAIAFPSDLNEIIDTRFYTYLPTKIECGFNILVHADFALDNARVSIPDSDYNNKILSIASKMLVQKLLTDAIFHTYESFAKFLMPIHKNDKFSTLVWDTLIKNDNLINILKKVYTKDADFPKESYALLFNIIKKWTPAHISYTPWGEEYWDKIVYEQCVKYFCHEDIYIIFIHDKYKSSLPTKEKDENNQKNKLFYIDEKKNDSQYDFSLLENLSNITLASMIELDDEIFIKNAIVKENRNIEIYKALVSEMEKNKDLSDKDKLNILKFLSTSANDDFNIDYFELDSKKRLSKAGNPLSKILLPTKNGSWEPAHKCFMDISSEVSKHFDGFYEVDDELIKEFFPNKVSLKFFGVWNTIPITNNFELPWSKENSPQIDTSEFKFLLQESISVWKEIEKISHQNIRELFVKIKEEHIFYDEINSNEKEKVFLKPSEVFLFDDNVKRVEIGQEKRDQNLKLLYEYLDIKLIEDTRDSKKLHKQLLKMADDKPNYEVNKTHKTLYKQLVLSLSKCENYQDFTSIPLLIKDGYRRNDSKVWFADRNSKKYTHKFALDYVLFEIETKKRFVQHFNVQLFEPEFSLKPDNAKEVSNTELKRDIEHQILPALFSLAEEIMGMRFNKYEAIVRWNKLKIGYAEDVWLEIQLNNSESIQYIGKDLKNNDVLFKPLSYSQRQEYKDQVGEIIHDLEGSGPNNDIIANPKFSKFGYVIADGVFRNTALGSVFSDYLKINSEDKQEFLFEQGLSEYDVEEMSNFVTQSVLIGDEIKEILAIINTLPSLNVNENNWFLLEPYRIKGFSFIDLIEKFKNNMKYSAVLEQLNPKSKNILHINNLKKDIQLQYYMKNRTKLDDETFSQQLKNIGDLLYKFDITKNEINDYFKVEEITEDEKLIAEIEISNDIRVEISNIQASKNLQCKASRQFNVKKETNTRKVNEEERLETSSRQQKRGLAYEKIFAIKQASKILNKDNLFISFQKEYRKIPGLKEDFDFEDRSLKNLANILQVSKTTGDGLGYDVLELEIKDDNVKVYKVEIKSSKNNHTVHFSNNEIIEIYKMIDDDNWKLYHFVDDNVYDRTVVIKTEIKTLVAQTVDKESNFLAESWIISFEE